jgi:hypothetical protein
MMNIAPILFDYKARESGYVLVNKGLPAEIDGQTSLVCPIVIDTEYWQALYDPTATTRLEPRKGVTIQMRGVAEGLEDTLVLIYPAQVAYCLEHDLPLRHEVFTHCFAGTDFLEHHGYEVKEERNPNRLRKEKVPTIQFVLYAHMALVETGMMVQGEDYLEDIYNAMRKNHLSFHRRLQATHTVKKRKSKQSKHQDFIPMQYWTLIVNGYRYNVELCIVDTVAVHGPASYKNLCANVGIQLSQKDEMHESGYISKMHRAYNDIAKIFDIYIIEDMRPEEALREWKKLVGNVYRLFGVSDHFRGEPRMTIGAAAKDLLEAVVYRGVGISPGDKEARDEFIALCLELGTAKTLIDEVMHTRCLLSKVDGGRCRNNQPTLAHLLGALCDIDIKSCYGEGLRCQYLPIGQPLIDDYPIGNPLHLSKTLRQFLEEQHYHTDSNQLVYGLWHARVSTLEGYRLQYPQDYLQSWVKYSVRDMRDIIWSKKLEDHDEVEEGLDVKSGTTKIFTREVRDAVITSDTLDWLFYVCGPAQREELLDCLHVKGAMIYPKCEQRSSPDEVLDVLRQKKTGTTSTNTYADDGAENTKRNKGPFAWYGFRLDGLLIDKLLEERGMHPKKIDAALNALYKLLINSTYGDLTSPYFTIANPTVGNNITARARSMAWYAEKGLNAFQTITDGGAFNLNRVVFPYQHGTIAAHRFVALHRSSSPKRDHNIQYGPLGLHDGVQDIKLDWERDEKDEKNIPLLAINDGLPLRGMNAHRWIEEKAMAHLQQVFPHTGIRVLHEQSRRLKFDNDDKPTRFEYIDRIGLYSFELKACYDEMTLHGPANYGVFQKGEMIDRAQRSYPRKKEYVTTALVEGHLVRNHLYDKSDPASVLHEALRCPTRVTRQKVFVRSSILMPSEWRHGEDSTWKHSALRPGDSWWKAGLLRELSLSQWTYETLEQWEAWEKAGNKLRNKYGQSFEMFFVHEDNTLNYQKMITTLDALVGLGERDPLSCLDPGNKRTRDLPMAHPELEALHATQAHLRWWQGLADDSDVMHNPSDDIAYAPPRAELYDAA